MRTQRVELEQIAAPENLLEAAWRAARGKRDRSDVAIFMARLEGNLTMLAEDIMTGRVPYVRDRVFTIRDPKVRNIQAACFADRVLHHAILRVSEHSFETAMVDSCYACRPGKGVHLAVARVQENLRKYPWFVKIDIEGYFANIQHATLKEMLARRFCGTGFLALLGRIIDGEVKSEGRAKGLRLGFRSGLPIGALTSQHFANLYLSSADRWLLERPEVHAHARYMDDIVWWGFEPDALKAGLLALRDKLQDELGLTVKPQSIQIQRSAQGMSYCGFRVRPGVVLASRRKLRRYVQAATGMTQERLRAVVHTDATERQGQRRSDELLATLASCQSERWRQRFWAEQLWGERT
jgi:RNA-directed DNA polymerase